MTLRPLHRHAVWCMLVSLLFAAAGVSAQTIPLNGNVVIVGSINYCDTTGSSVNAYACNLGYNITQYTPGDLYLFKANLANTLPATLQLNGIPTPVTIQKMQVGTMTNLRAGDIALGDVVLVTYTGTVMRMLSTTSNFPTQLDANPANCTVAGTFPNGVDASGVSENCVTLSAVNPQTTTYPVVDADFDNYKTIVVASGTFIITLRINTSQPAAGKYIRVINYGSGVVTIARNGQNLNGGTASLVLPPGSATAPTAAQIISDGTNYFGDTSFGNPLTTAGDVLYGGASGTPTRLATGTAKQILTAGTTPAYIDFPDFHYFPAANCVNAVAGVAWSTGATPAGACRAGTNNLEGYLTWGASDTAQWHIGLPLDWNSAVNPSVSLQLASTDAVNGHTVIMQLATACAKGDGTVTDDVAFNTAQSFATVTLNGTASRQWKTTVSNITMTGCTAGGMLRLKLSRTTDTATNVQVYGLGITIPRLLTVQAN